MTEPISLRGLLTAPPLVEHCRIDCNLTAGDVAECGCIVKHHGEHIRSGTVWLNAKEARNATYYGWKIVSWPDWRGDQEVRMVRR